jgi:plasmid maintenance system antidote protein VapI
MCYEERKHPLLDFLKKENQFNSDGALARALGLKAPTISKIRAGKSNVSAEVKLIVHKKTGMSIADIEALLGERDDARGTDV